MPQATPLVLFEPAGIEAFGPPVALRPVWELRVGARRLVERVADAWPGELHFAPRASLAGLCPALPPALFAAPRVLLLAGHQLVLERAALDRLESLALGDRLEADGQALALCLSGADARDWLAAEAARDAQWPAPTAAPHEGPFGPRLGYWWELYELAPRALAQDAESLLAAGGWQRGEREGVWLAAGATLAPGSVIDASGGPVLLDRGASVGALSVLTGPCYLGAGTRTKPHTQLHGVFAGPECRLGGEIEETQLQGYANKQHHGFLGHAAVGEWVNLGAGATNSDLKNNYGSIRVEMGGRSLDSGRRFLGCCLGDHVKLGIQGRLNTGTVLEPFTNWFGADFPPKGLPAFSWGGEGRLEEHALERALATAAIVMPRRGARLDEGQEAAIRALFARSAAARRARFG